MNSLVYYNNTAKTYVQLSNDYIIHTIRLDL